MCRGVRRTQHRASRPLRQPITPNHLRSMVSFIAGTQFTLHDKAMWNAAILTAFFGLLRMSEYTSPKSHTFDPLTDLCMSNLSFHGSQAHLALRSSKTDPFREGVVIRLFPSQGTLCPVRALRHFYFSFRHNMEYGPLFVMQNGHYLTRNYMKAFLMIAIPTGVNINTHSFRIGGASAAASRGVPDSVIQMMGRWRSDCFRRYIRMDDRIVENWCRQVGKEGDLSTTWRFD